MREGIKVVVAQPGTMMPSGALIWDGALRGVQSSGMIVSGRELRYQADAPDKPGTGIARKTLVKWEQCLILRRRRTCIRITWWIQIIKMATQKNSKCAADVSDAQ